LKPGGRKLGDRRDSKGMLLLKIVFVKRRGTVRTVTRCEKKACVWPPVVAPAGQRF
jgi:hypothetical protein